MNKNQEETGLQAGQEQAGTQLSDMDYMRDRIVRRHPDLTFEDDAAWQRQMRADADLDDKRLADYEAADRETEALFAADPRSAEWWVLWRKNKGKSPIAALIRTYGGEFLREGLDDPDLADQIEEAEKEYLATVTEGREYGEQVQRNLDTTLDTAEQYAKDNGLTTEDVDKLLDQVFDRFKHIQLGIVTAEDLDWVRKMQNYDEAMADARAEGEVVGRNTRIRETLRKAGNGDGVPSMGGSASTRTDMMPGLDGKLDDYQRGSKAASEAPERRSRQRYNG